MASGNGERGAGAAGAALAVGLLLAACGLPPPGPAGVEVLDADGRPADAFEGLRGSRAIVFVFTRTDCPVANRYAPELRRLTEEFGARGVAFRLVYPGERVEAAAIERHRSEYGLTMPPLRDPALALVRHCGATITPEAALFAPDGRMVYRGRIDDRYVDFGQVRPRATRRDLTRAIEALLDGRPVETPRTDAVGCFIADLAEP